MRALLLTAAAPIETAPLVSATIAVPEPGPDELLIRVAACGLCRTDLHIIEGELPLQRVPLVPGHQIVGRVERPAARAHRFRVGDRVGVAWLRRACGGCDDCVRGRENLCEAAEFTGYSTDGGYAEFATVPEDFAYPIPSVFDDVEAAPLLCAGIIGYRALTLAAVPPGGVLGMYGFGSSAHLTLQVARARGCTVFVCTRDPSHQALARALGATWAGSAADRAPQPMDGIVLFAPSGALVPVALRQLRKGGTLALAGIVMSPIPPLEYGDLFHERVIRSVTASTRTDGERLLDEAARIPLRPQAEAFPLGEANRALERLKRGAIRGTGVLVL